MLPNIPGLAPPRPNIPVIFTHENLFRFNCLSIASFSVLYAAIMSRGHCDKWSEDKIEKNSVFCISLNNNVNKKRLHYVCKPADWCQTFYDSSTTDCRDRSRNTESTAPYVKQWKFLRNRFGLNLQLCSWTHLCTPDNLETSSQNPTATFSFCRSTMDSRIPSNRCSTCWSLSSWRAELHSVSHLRTSKVVICTPD